MITKEQWLILVSKVDQTFEDEFKAEYNSPELIFPLMQRLLKQCSVSGSLPILDDETATAPIQDALYATGKFTTDDCSTLADGILQYIRDAGFSIVGRQ
jgi:hypothetical protein